MFSSDFFPIIQQAFPDVTAPAVPEKTVREPAAQLAVPPERLLALCRFLKESSELKFDLPLEMTAVDLLKEGVFELIYVLYSTRDRRAVLLKSRVARSAPIIDSVTSVWSGMNWQEREVFDLFGIVFRGHPNLKRIMMWDGFPGHPLRKDYVHVTDAYDSGLEIGTPGLDERGVPVKQA